ncbi:substrate-binding periplasmic protein [Chitinimonas naiadis]
MITGKYLWLFICMLAALAGRAEPLRFVTAIPADRPVWGAVDQALQRIFHRGGLEYTVEHYPAERAMQLLLKHRVDGDVARTGAFGVLAPQLLRVTPPFYSSYLLSLSHDARIRPRSASDLQHLRVAYIRGFKFAEQVAAAGRSRQAVDSIESCLRLVRAGRDDVCIANRYLVAKALMQLGNDDVFYLDRVARVDTYLYLDRRHWAKAGELHRLLAAMQRSGELRQLNQAINRAVDQELGHYAESGRNPPSRQVTVLPRA